MLHKGQYYSTSTYATVLAAWVKCIKELLKIVKFIVKLGRQTIDLPYERSWSKFDQPVDKLLLYCCL